MESFLVQSNYLTGTVPEQYSNLSSLGKYNGLGGETNNSDKGFSHHNAFYLSVLPNLLVQLSVYANPDLVGTIPVGMCELTSLETIEVGTDQIQCDCSQCIEIAT